MKKKNKTKKDCLPRKQGFSLIETLIAVFIFSLVMTMLIQIFVGFLKNYTKSRTTQRDIENVQYAMNLMAKTIRTSDVPNFSGQMTSFMVFDYSQTAGNCIRYTYDLNSSTISISLGTAGNLADCSLPSTVMSNPTVFVNNVVDAEIDSEKTVTGGPSIDYGKVTISLQVKDAMEGIARTPIQMTVSLRQ